MELEVLVATMNLKTKKENEELIRKMKIKTNSLTISQSKENNYKSGNTNEKNRLVLTNKTGLSNNRNDCLNYAEGKICIIADDDIIYTKNYDEIIKQAYKQNPNYDLIIFAIDDKNTNRKNKKISKSKKIGFLEIFRLSSNQITFKKDIILEKNIKFDLNFGVNAKYPLGEDTIFLSDCLKKGLKIKYINNVILEKPENESGWFVGYNEKYFISEGACFYRINKYLYNILILQFAIRKYKKYNKDVKFLQCIKLMKKGAKEYKKFNTNT